MPAQRPRASFEPIAPDFDLKTLVESTPNFQYVDRISCDMIEKQGLVAFEKLVLLHVITGGKPLVIDGFEEQLDPWTFTPKWLRDNCGDKVENAQNLTAKEQLPLTMGHYLKNMGLLTNQFFDKPGAYREKNRQRVYLKDIDCPPVWWDKLKEHIPQMLAYLNDSTGDIGGPGAKPDPHSTVPGRRLGKGIARAGDLMSSLPPDMRAENLMCYIGHEGTYTPAHREMCASLGQNIMVEASNTVSDDGKAEKPGSSIWFMTESKDRHTVSEYFLSVLGHDIEVENHFAQVVAWKKAPFKVYVVEQRPGDFLLIPPLAPHQVWNRGTRTMKVAWNRTTVETLEMALNEAIPRSRIVCREEQYKNKAIVYYSLQKYASLLHEAQRQTAMMARDQIAAFLYTGKLKQLQKDFKRLFAMYKQILLTEMFSPEDRDAPKNIEYIPFDSNVTCAYCRCNIFNRFLTCPYCKDLLGHHADSEDGDPYDVCMDCYAMGRSCACISGLKWVEQFKWKELISKYEVWRKMIIELDGGTTEKTPRSLIDERRRYGKKTLAEVCKDQLKRRPFKDVKKQDEPKEDNESDEEIVVGDDGTVKKVTKKKSKSWLKNNKPCHVCCHRHPVWKMAQCTTCERAWCYGSLFRGWDKMPMQIMENPDWSCPHCLEICFAGNCKREGKMQPYEPKGTLLGHDTKKIADVRSVEALVDFSVSNLNWLKEDDPANRAESKRLKRARAEADMERRNEDQGLDEDDAVDAIEETQVEYTMVDDTTALDPALGGNGAIPSGSRHSDCTNNDNEADLARRLQMVNSTLLVPAAMAASALVDANGVPDGYAAVNAAGYSGYLPEAQMYPDPVGGNRYAYPGQNRDESDSQNPDDATGKKKKKGEKRRRSRKNGEEDDEEDIAMSKAPKQKKPRLAAAGFRSIDLAEEAVGPAASKAKNEAQRQFEKEKEKKALEKAKAEGRFIMLQAAIKGKKRIVKMRLSGYRLAQVIAQQAARAAMAAADDEADAEHEVVDGTAQPEEEENDHDALLLKSDISPKKKAAQAREQRMRDGIVLTGSTKKALVPVEKDDSYGYTYREKLPNGQRVRRDLAKQPPTLASKKQKRKNQGRTIYEEVDIGSDDDDDFENESSFVAINTSSSRRNGRSLPGYLQNRHEDDNKDVPTALPDDHRDRSHKPSTRVKKVRASGADEQLQQETADAAGAMLQRSALSSKKAGRPTGRPLFGGKAPTVRPSSANEPITIDDYNDSSDDDGDDDDDDAAAANGDFGERLSVHVSAHDRTATATDQAALKALAKAAGEEGAEAEMHAREEAQAKLQAEKVAQERWEQQRRVAEENRLAKLQALEMFSDDMYLSKGRPSSSRQNGVMKGSMKGGSLDGEENFDDESDDGIDEVPARGSLRA